MVALSTKSSKANYRAAAHCLPDLIRIHVGCNLARQVGQASVESHGHKNRRSKDDAVRRFSAAAASLKKHAQEKHAPLRGPTVIVGCGVHVSSGRPQIADSSRLEVVRSTVSHGKCVSRKFPTIPVVSESGELRYSSPGFSGTSIGLF